MASWLDPLWAAIATAGFAVIFNLRRRDVPIAAMGAALSWAVYELVSAATAAQAVGFFAAAAVVGLWAEIIAAFLKRPASVYIVCAIIPLVPGSGMYYTMLASVKGQTWSAITEGLATLQAAGAIAAGLALSSAAARLISPRRLARRLGGSAQSRDGRTIR